jgi:hypothetical protein
MAVKASLRREVGRMCRSVSPPVFVWRGKVASNFLRTRRTPARLACCAVAVGTPGALVHANWMTTGVVPRASSVRTPFLSPYACPPARLRDALWGSSASLLEREPQSACGYMASTAERPLVLIAASATCRPRGRAQAKYGCSALRSVAKVPLHARRGGSAIAGAVCNPAIRGAPRCATRAIIATGRMSACPIHACQASGVTGTPEEHTLLRQPELRSPS